MLSESEASQHFNFTVNAGRTITTVRRGNTMATGWAKDGAVQEQIDASIEDALKSVRARLPRGNSLMHCAECGEDIPLARRQAIRGVRLCMRCQSRADEQVKAHSLYNRRGSKDSQLR
jgi:phage/conjugal plasmid C-4 type zinc finger TraR family protein